jgi:hypothetical protein
MKNLMLTACLVLGLLIAPMAMADTVTVNRVTGYYSGNGGEFTLYPSFPVPSDYVPSITSGIGADGPNFQTFCVETTEFVNIPSGNYEVVFNNGAVYGNGGGNGSYDPLSVGTAWLYYQFQLGTLENYYYNSSSGSTFSNRAAAAGDLQKAIWWLEGESGGDSNAYYSKLIVDASHFGSEMAAMADNLGNIRQSPVGVLNLWDVGYVGVSGHQHQDQLVCVPEPGILILLGIAMSAIGISVPFVRKI